MNYITLNNGVKIPQIGLGVFRTPDGADTANAVNGRLRLDTDILIQLRFTAMKKA